MAEHTKTPWRINKYGSIGYGEFGTDPIVAHVELFFGNEADFHSHAANAAFIVKAVNCHDELVGAIDKIDSVMRRNLTCSNKLDKIAGILTDLDHLLAKAREV